MAPVPLPRASQATLMCAPARPAAPKNSTYSDHRYATVTPTDTSVSMVAAPCRALTTAARWNGHAPHTATGEASASDAHCQFRNCRGEIIASATTGMASASDTSSRFRNTDVSPAPSSSAAPPADSPGGAGRGAVEPARSTTHIKAGGGLAARELTPAGSRANLPVGVRPSSLLSFSSPLAAHEAQVIPPIASSTARTAPPGAAAGLTPVTMLIRTSPPSYAVTCTTAVLEKDLQAERTGYHARPEA